MNGTQENQMCEDVQNANPIIGTGIKKGEKLSTRKRLPYKDIVDIRTLPSPPTTCLRCKKNNVDHLARGICNQCYSFLYERSLVHQYPKIFKQRSIVERFESKISKTDTCWIWIGNKTKNGYGLFSVEGSWLLAHRVSWVATHGKIQDELNVLHKCDVRSCVNPDHLFLGTLKDNMQDCSRKGRLSFNAPGYKGAQCWQAKLTNEDVVIIRKRAKNGERGIIKKLAKEYNVHQSTISDAVNGNHYKNI